MSKREFHPLVDALAPVLSILLTWWLISWGIGKVKEDCSEEKSFMYCFGKKSKQLDLEYREGYGEKK